MLHSFIFNSESPRTVRKLLSLIIMVIITLLITDVLLGRLLPSITIEPPFILRFENVPGVEALWDFSDAGIQPIVFTGSSQTYTGLSPHLFDKRLKAISGQEVKSVNVSILGSVVIMQRDLIRNLIIPNHPKIIFYGIEMRALRSSSQDEGYFLVSDFRNKSLGNAVSQQSPLERNVLLWLLQYSNWVRYRDNLREWLTGVRAMNEGDYFLTAVDDLGYAPFPDTSSQNPANITDQYLPFTMNDSTRQMLIDIATNCQENGVQCILLNVPLHELAYQYITPAEEALYRDVLHDAKLPLWDFNTQACRTLLGDVSFFNVNHLNSKGAELFSQMVADAYAQEFFDVPISDDANCATLSP